MNSSCKWTNFEDKTTYLQRSKLGASYDFAGYPVNGLNELQKIDDHHYQPFICQEIYNKMNKVLIDTIIKVMLRS